MTKAPRLMVEVEVDCDTKRLYGTIDEAIKYLQEVKEAHKGIDIQLDECWTGYEDMHMRFVYSRPETDKEYADRRKQEQAEARRKAQRDKEERELAQRRNQYERLKREFG